MHTFTVHTLVDITHNGLLKGDFPFKTKANEIVHDRDSLFIARNQNSNFTTMLQLLQVRGNITWDSPPKKTFDIIANSKFGTAYQGKQTNWDFTFFVEQEGIYGKASTNYVGNLIDDFDLIPVITFCKETVTFPSNSFITQNNSTLNTYFSYGGIYNK